MNFPMCDQVTVQIYIAHLSGPEGAYTSPSLSLSLHKRPFPFAAFIIYLPFKVDVIQSERAEINIK